MTERLHTWHYTFCRTCEFPLLTGSNGAEPCPRCADQKLIVNGINKQIALILAELRTEYRLNGLSQRFVELLLQECEPNSLESV